MGGRIGESWVGAWAKDVFHACYGKFPVEVSSMRQTVVSGESPQLKSGKDLIFEVRMDVFKHMILHALTLTAPCFEG